MGYYVELTRSKFVIKKDDFDKALTGLKSVFTEDNMTISDSRGKRFYWVNTRRVLESKTLPDALRAIGYIAVHDGSENICELKFARQKIGDEDIFFEALAPYVQSGSYLSYCGEDEMRWKWKFRDGKMTCEIKD